MTTINRRPRTVSRYVVRTFWDQETARYVHCVLDTKERTWARGAKPEGYFDRREAETVAEQLRAKEKP